MWNRATLYLRYRPFRLQLQQAELAAASTTVEPSDAQIRAAQAKLKSAQATADEQSREAQRIKDLVKEGSTSEQAFDQAQSAALQAQANVDAVKSQLESLKVQRGDSDNTHNLLIQQAKNAVDNAELNLSYTTVRAQHAGRVNGKTQRRCVCSSR